MRFFALALTLSLALTDWLLAADASCPTQTASLANARTREFLKAPAEQLRKREAWTADKAFQTLAISTYPYTTNYLPHPRLFREILDLLAIPQADSQTPMLSLQETLEDLHRAIFGKDSEPIDRLKETHIKLLKQGSGFIQKNSQRQVNDLFFYIDQSFDGIFLTSDRTFEKKVLLAIYYLLSSHRPPNISDKRLQILTDLLYDRRLWTTPPIRQMNPF
jgi:hypothetical protein